MTDKTRDDLPLYPADNTFVLQLRRGCGRPGGTCAGLVEHLSSGRAKKFTSVAELVAFVQDTVAKAENDAPQNS